jgi:hypothetical protein
MRIRTLLTLVVVLAGLTAFAAPPAQAEVAVSISFFHEHLSPYGRWVAAGSYGNCWVPSGVSTGWAPYVDGEWVWTDYGWTWDSLDPWGDVAYHYGTWAWEDPYGWVWVPGTIWAPAWVTWAYTDDFIGWAPVPPSFALSANGYWGAPIVVSQTRYVFVPTNRFVGVNVANVRVPAAQTAAIFPRATKVTNYKISGGIVHAAGPPTSRIERVIGHPVQRVSVDRAKTRPTTIAAAGARKAGRLSIVAPASERARIGASSAAAPPRGGHEAAAPLPGRGKEKVAKGREAKQPPPKASRPETRSVRSENAKPQPQPKAERPANRTVRSERAKPHEAGPRTGHTAGGGSDVPPPAAAPPAHARPQPHAERARPQGAQSHAAPPGQTKKQARPKPNQGQEKDKKD